MKPQNRAEEFLKLLVEAPSPTTNQRQVGDAHSILASALTDLGFKLNWVKDQTGKTDHLLVAEKPGARSKSQENAFITLVSHIDTVMSPHEAGPLRLDPQGRVLGAGIIDNKGGLAILVESLRLFLEKTPEPELGFRVVSSPDEEAGSTAWHSIFKDIGARSCAVLGFEPALDDGSIITSRRGNRWYDVSLVGISAHAGRCQGEELNAAHEAALVICDLNAKLEKIRQANAAGSGLGVALNVGHIQGGHGRHNVVCGKVELKIDARFSTFGERDQIHAMVVESIEKRHLSNNENRKVERQWKIVDDCPPFFSGADQVASEVVTDLLEKIQIEERNQRPRVSQAGGAGDVNHMSRPGLFMLDGLGPIGGNMHRPDEFLIRESISTRSKALANWYSSLSRLLR